MVANALFTTILFVSLFPSFPLFFSLLFFSFLYFSSSLFSSLSSPLSSFLLFVSPLFNQVDEKLSFHSEFISGLGQSQSSKSVDGKEDEDPIVACLISRSARPWKQIEWTAANSKKPGKQSKQQSEPKELCCPPPHPFLDQVREYSSRCPSSIVVLSEIRVGESLDSTPFPSSNPSSDSSFPALGARDAVAGMTWLPMNALWGMMRCGDPRKTAQVRLACYASSCF